MKDNKLLSILMLIFLWIITVLLGIIINQNLYDDILGNTRSIFYVFIVVNIIHFFYFIFICYLRKKRRVKTIAVFLSAPPLMVFIVLTIIFLIGYKIITLGRVRYINLGSESFYPCADFKSESYISIWNTDYWLSNSDFYKKYYDEEITKIQKKRRGCIIGHLGTELVDWSDEKIKTAFGEPAKIIKVDENLKKWIYYPWTHNPDWEMPVYVQNGTLLKIGD